MANLVFTKEITSNSKKLEEHLNLLLRELAQANSRVKTLEDRLNKRDVTAGDGLTGDEPPTVGRTISLPLTGVTPGTYSNVQITVDAYGRIVAITDAGASSHVNTMLFNGIED